MSESGVANAKAARSRAAIRAATRELIARGGAGSVTHQRVAEAAGVGRATVYRHFATVTDLVEDAFLGGGIPPLDLSGTTDLHQELRRALVQLTRELTNPETVAVIVTVLDRARNPGTAQALRDAFVGSLVDQLEAGLARAEATGQLTQRGDPGRLFDLLVGPVLSQTLLRDGHPTEAELDEIVSCALESWLPADQRSHRPRP